MDHDAFDVSDDVLQAALAFIDDVYVAAEHSASTCVRRSRRQEETQQLRLQVDELELWLDILQWIRAGDDATTQQQDAARTNALLRHAATEQRALATQVVSTLEHARRALAASLIPRVESFSALPLRVPVPPILAQHLDAVHKHVLSVCDVHVPFVPQESMQWRLAADVMQFDSRRSHQYPFKLSAVASELWKMLNENSDGHVPCRCQDDENTSCFSLQVHKPYGRIEMDGTTAGRRTFLPDGSVLLAIAHVATGPPIADNLMAGLETLEVTWMRIAHLERGNARSQVVIEIAHHVDIHVAGRARPSDVVARLERVRAFNQRRADEARPQSRQVLENRLLTSNLACRSTSLVSQ